MLAFEAFGAKENGAGLMHRYQAHLERCYARAFKAFMDLRTKMKFLNELEANDEQEAPIGTADVRNSNDVQPSDLSSEPATAAAEEQEHATEQIPLSENKPGKLEENKPIQETTKRTSPHPVPIRPTQAADTRIGPHDTPTAADRPREGGPGHEEAA
jgi:hypothetical protein